MKTRHAFSFAALLLVLGCGPLTPSAPSPNPPSAPTEPTPSTPSDDPAPTPEAPAGILFYACDATTLYEIDPQGWTLRTVGNFGATEPMADIALSPDGMLYGVSSFGLTAKLYAIDRTTAAATELADFTQHAVVGGGTLSSFSGLSFNDAGELLAPAFVGGGPGFALVKISLSQNALSIVTGLADSGLTPLDGDMVGVSDGTLFGVAADQTVAPYQAWIITANAATGTTERLRPLSLKYSDGPDKWLLGFAYINGAIFGFSGGGAVYQIDRASGNATSVAMFAGKSFTGAAVTPKVPLTIY